MNFVRYHKLRKIFRFGYITAGIIMLLLAFLTYYGQISGNFVMSVDDDAFKRGIAISDKKDFKMKNILRDKQSHYVMITGSIQEEDTTI